MVNYVMRRCLNRIRFYPEIFGLNISILSCEQLDQTDIKILDEFFYNAEQIELARKSIIKAMENGWHSKALAEQYILATYLSSGIDQKLSHLPGEQPDFTAIDSFVEQKCRLFSQTFEPGLNCLPLIFQYLF